MCAKQSGCRLRLLKNAALLFLLELVLINPASAVEINFDDIPYIPIDPDMPQFDDVELTDQYSSKGVLIDGGYLGRRYPVEDHLANPQFLLGGNFLRLIFVGDTLPTYVSMTISSLFDYANFLNFYGPDGHLYELQTSGYAGPQPANPYQENQPVSFTSETGITEITFSGFFNMRWGTLIDNLRFMSLPTVTINEPDVIVLFILGAGLLVLIGQRRSA